MKTNYLTKVAFLTLSLTGSVFAAEGIETINKDVWLGKLKEGVPSVICKNFTSNEAVNNQLKAKNIDYEKCIALIPQEFETCKSKFYSSMPENLDKEGAGDWGRKIGECIGTDFAQTHLGVTVPVTTSTDSSNANKGSSADMNTSNTTSTASASSDSSPQSMTKDEWLGKLKDAVPSLICKGFLDDKELNARLTKMKIDYAKCLTLLPASVDKCQTEFYSQLPASIDSTSAGKWGHSIGECIGKDFAIKYLVGN